MAVEEGVPKWSNVQGNVAGFLKDHQAFLFLRFDDPAGARAWVEAIRDDVATVDEVQQFNELFKQVLDRHHREGAVEANWMNVAFTHGGLQKLAAPEVERFPEVFRQGMRARAPLIGDVGDNAPETWDGGLGILEIDALLLLASDRLRRLHDQVDHFVRLGARHGVHVVFGQEGHTRADDPGHEHFGFKDGISQPSIEGLDEPEPGKDQVAAGEFVAGFRRQPGGIPEPNQAGYDPAREPDPYAGPGWMPGGTYLVFRRLRQDVPAFRQFVEDQAPLEGPPFTVDLFGAKLVGRYMTGVPLALANNAPEDPGRTDRTLLEDDKINAFEYDDDPDGANVPRAAHIRKVYPRAQVPPGDEEADRRRILRRGIPFGRSFHRGGAAGTPYAPSPGFPHDRGLLFLCYQASIERQFEFIQSRWVNNPEFPVDGDGEDPVIAQAVPARSFHLPAGAVDPVHGLQQWVRTTGGEYFFQPSIEALGILARSS